MRQLIDKVFFDIELFKAVLQRKNMSYTTLAEDLGITRSAVAKRNCRGWSRANFIDMLKVLKMSEKVAATENGIMAYMVEK